MTEKKEIFADGIGKIHFAGGLVRFDFMSIQPENKDVLNSVVRVIMPPQGFLGAYNSMEQLIDRLVEAGVFTKNEPAPEQKNAPEKKSAATRNPQQKNKKNKKK